MTKEKAIDLLDNLIGMVEDNQNSDYDTALKMCIKALKQETIIDKIEKEINSQNRGTCDYFIVDKIEEIINKYKSESEKL